MTSLSGLPDVSLFWTIVAKSKQVCFSPYYVDKIVCRFYRALHELSIHYRIRVVLKLLQHKLQKLQIVSCISSKMLQQTFTNTDITA